MLTLEGIYVVVSGHVRSVFLELIRSLALGQLDPLIELFFKPCEVTGQSNTITNMTLTETWARP